MALPQGILQREYDKFRDPKNLGKTTVAVTNWDGSSLAGGVGTTFAHGALSSLASGGVYQLPTYATSQGVLVKASINNTGYVYIGNASVTPGAPDATCGFEMIKGESLLVLVDNADKVYIASGNDNQKIFFFLV